MAQVTESIGKLIDEFAKLPGIGRKSAERLAYHVLRVPQDRSPRPGRCDSQCPRECALLP